jgi:hypothetical protein
MDSRPSGCRSSSLRLGCAAIAVTAALSCTDLAGRGRSEEPVVVDTDARHSRRATSGPRFVLAFPTNLAAIVGQQITLTASSGAAA